MRFVTGVLGAVLLFACEDDTQTGGAGGSGGDVMGGGGAVAGGNGGTGGAGGAATVAYEATITGLDPPNPVAMTTWVDLGPIEGMEVCLIDGDPAACASTDASGAVVLDGVPANANVAFRFTHAEYPPWLLQYVTTTSDEIHQPSFARHGAAVDASLAGAGCTDPPALGKGNLLVGTPVGASVAVSPQATVVYMDAAGYFDPTLTSCGAGGFAVLCDLDPGLYALDFSGALGSCQRVEGWPSAGHDLDAKIEADTFTVVNWICN